MPCVSVVSILAGGVDIGTQVFNTVNVHDLSLHITTQLPPMNTPRQSFALFCLHDRLYAIGGSCGHDMGPQVQSALILPSAIIPLMAGNISLLFTAVVGVLLAVPMKENCTSLVEAMAQNVLILLKYMT